MSQVVLDIPGETLLALKVSAEESAETLQMAAAVKLFATNAPNPLTILTLLSL